MFLSFGPILLCSGLLENSLGLLQESEHSDIEKIHHAQQKEVENDREEAVVVSELVDEESQLFFECQWTHKRQEYLDPDHVAKSIEEFEVLVLADEESPDNDQNVGRLENQREDDRAILVELYNQKNVKGDLQNKKEKSEKGVESVDLQIFGVSESRDDTEEVSFFCMNCGFNIRVKKPLIC